MKPQSPPALRAANAVDDRLPDEDQDTQPAGKSQEDVWYETYVKAPYKDIAQRMLELRNEIASAELAVKNLKSEFDVIRLRVVPTRFAEDSTTSMRIEGLGRISLTSDAYCTVLPGQQDQLFEFLKSIDCEDLIKPTVNSSSLKSLIKDLYATHVTTEKELDLAAALAGNEEKDDFQRALEVVRFEPFMRASITKG